MLASRFGFDADEVWNDSANDELRERRSTPEMLAPGDVVYLPDAAPEPRSLSARTNNRFRGRLPTVPVEVAFHYGGEPIANTSCTVEGLPQPLNTETDGDGVARFDAPMNSGEVWVVFEDPSARFRVMVGHLDPHDEDSGALHRLVNLGYGSDAALRTGGEVRASHLHQMLMRFQADHDLEPSGELDESTRSALQENHGS